MDAGRRTGVAIDGGDLDGDGDLNLATANRFSDTVSVPRNHGDATFEPQFPFGVGMLPSSVSRGCLRPRGHRCWRCEVGEGRLLELESVRIFA